MATRTRESPPAGTSQAGVHRESAARTLGSEPGSGIYLHSPEPINQEIPPEHDFPCRAGARRAVLQDIYEVSKKFWIAEYFPEDADGGEGKRYHQSPNGVGDQ